MLYICLILVFTLYALFDVHYFVRGIFIVFVLKLFRKKHKILDESIFYGMCTTQDIAWNIGYMSFARYLRELDFARFLFSTTTGLYSEIIKQGITVVGASVINYWGGIPIFTPYKIVTKAIYWEGRCMYMQQTCITLHDNSIRAVSVAQHCLVGPDMTFDQIVAVLEPTTRVPDIPKDLDLWRKSLEETSKKLRRTD